MAENNEQLAADLLEQIGYLNAKINCEMAHVEKEEARFEKACARFNEHILDLEKAKAIADAKLVSLIGKPSKPSKRDKQKAAKKAPEPEPILEDEPITVDVVDVEGELVPVVVKGPEPTSEITISMRKANQ